MSSEVARQSDSIVHEVNSLDSITYSGLGRRLLAFVLDMVAILLVFGLIQGAIGLVLGVLGYRTDPGNNRFWDLVLANFAFTLWAIAILSYFVCFILLEARSGATLGKRLLGIRVTTLSGVRIGWMASFLRNLIRPIDLLGGFLFALGPRRQRLGDRAARTILVGNR